MKNDFFSKFPFSWKYLAMCLFIDKKKNFSQSRERWGVKCIRYCESPRGSCLGISCKVCGELEQFVGNHANTLG